MNQTAPGVCGYFIRELCQRLHFLFQEALTKLVFNDFVLKISDERESEHGFQARSSLWKFTPDLVDRMLMCLSKFTSLNR